MCYIASCTTSVNGQSLYKSDKDSKNVQYKLFLKYAF